jgi:hypothetical protein
MNIMRSGSMTFCSMSHFARVIFPYCHWYLCL